MQFACPSTPLKLNHRRAAHRTASFQTPPSYRYLIALAFFFRVHQEIYCTTAEELVELLRLPLYSTARASSLGHDHLST